MGDGLQNPDLSQLTAMMEGAGVRRLFVKQVAPNDNSKHGVYLGSDFQAVNIFPNSGIESASQGANPIFKAALDFWWLDRSRHPHKAPAAQLILYPQYPEVRLSGFLKGCQEAPSKLMGSSKEGRLLFLGVADDGRIVAHAAGHDSAAAIQFRALENIPQEGVFFRLVLGVARFGADARERLLRELRRIHLKRWIPSKRLLTNGTEVPCNARNCGGLTLEAEFGIRPNSSTAPDFMGWELKQHAVPNLQNPAGGGPVTVMTPEPTGGFYKEKGFNKFVLKFGYADRNGKTDRLNVGGIHFVNRVQRLTDFTMTLIGYNASTGKITDGSGRIALVHSTGVEAATWAFTDLMAHWNKKHPFAAYVPSIHEKARNEYQYGPVVRLGEGTDFLRFLRAMADGKVYYDPGIKLEQVSTAHPKSKRRSQFRIKSADLPLLYDKMEQKNVT